MGDVDIAAAVEWARRVAAISDEQGQSCHEYEFATRVIIALADERATVEQRTAERIAAWIEGADLTKSDERGHIVTGIRAQRWKEHP